MSWLWCHGCAQKGPFHKVGAAAENDLAPKVASMCPLGCSKTIEECSLHVLVKPSNVHWAEVAQTVSTFCLKNTYQWSRLQCRFIHCIALGCCWDSVGSMGLGPLLKDFYIAFSITFRTLVLDTWQLMEPFFCLNWLTVRCCHWWCRWCRQWPQCHKRRRVSQHISCNSVV